MGKKPKSREEALAIVAKRKRAIDNPAERKLQRNIVTSFVAKYPERRLDLMGYDANAANGREGAEKMGQGVIPNVPDLTYWRGRGRSVGLELKTPTSRHDTEHCKGQAKWMDSHTNEGYFITTIDMFWHVVNGGKGIPTSWVLDHEGVTLCFKEFDKRWHETCKG